VLQDPSILGCGSYLPGLWGLRNPSLPPEICLFVFFFFFFFFFFLKRKKFLLIELSVVSSSPNLPQSYAIHFISLLPPLHFTPRLLLFVHLSTLVRFQRRLQLARSSSAIDSILLSLSVAWVLGV